MNAKLNGRFLALSAPQVMQYALDAASSTWYYTKMAQYGEEQGGAYGVADALTVNRHHSRHHSGSSGGCKNVWGKYLGF